MKNAGLRVLQVSWLALLGAAAAHGWPQAPRVRVATALDGPTNTDLSLRESLQREATRLLEGRYDILFPDDKQLIGDWSAAAARRNVDSLLADPQIDVVVVLGIIGPAYVTRQNRLPKPVIAAVVLDPETERIPVRIRERPLSGRPGVERVRVSGVPNLSYVSYNQDVVREVEAFHEITPFSKLTILVIEGVEDALAEMRRRLIETLQAKGIEATFVPVGTSVGSALSSIADDAQAVLIGPMPHLTDEAFQQLIRSLERRRLPTFALGGDRDVRRGAMASLKKERNELFLVRRVALNLFNILQGEDPSELAVDFNLDEQLTINMTTARAVGVDPTFALLTKAELVDATGTPPVRVLSLASVVREATSVNLDLAAARRRVESGRQLVKEVRSNLLPQIGVAGGAAFIDGDRSSPIQGRRQTSGSLTATQLIYSEEARSAYDVERHRQTSRQEELSELRLDVIQQAAQQYLNILRAKSIERIQKKNLTLTRSNLSLARTRVDVGTARRDELLRWQSQIALNRRNVIDASAQRNLSEIALNATLDRALEEAFETVEAGLSDPQLTVNFERLRPYVERPGSFKLFRRFMSRDALEASPELKRLDAAIRAQERSLTASRRAFFIPTVGLDTQIRTVKNGGVPSTGLPSPDNLDWSVALNASLPLFQGGALRARRARAKTELEELTVRRSATQLLVDQRVRSALHQAGASFASIDLTRQAAQAAEENLQLVRDAYSEGAADIVRVLDAQSQALSAELDAANAVFEHLIDLMEAQRAVGRFDYFRSAPQQSAFIRRLEAFFQDQGHAVKKN